MREHAGRRRVQDPRRREHARAARPGGPRPRRDHLLVRQPRTGAGLRRAAAWCARGGGYADDARRPSRSTARAGSAPRSFSRARRPPNAKPRPSASSRRAGSSWYRRSTTRGSSQDRAPSGWRSSKTVPDVQDVYVPVGGGGLLAGVAAAVKALKPDARVIGVEPAGAAKMSRSLAAGAPVTLDAHVEHRRRPAAGAPGRPDVRARADARRRGDHRRRGRPGRCRALPRARGEDRRGTQRGRQRCRHPAAISGRPIGSSGRWSRCSAAATSRLEKLAAIFAGD